MRGSWRPVPCLSVTFGGGSPPKLMWKAYRRARGFRIRTKFPHLGVGGGEWAHFEAVCPWWSWWSVRLVPHAGVVEAVSAGSQLHETSSGSQTECHMRHRGVGDMK